jgi:O-antigen ligase
MRKLAFVLSLIVVFTIPWENAVTFGDWGTLPRVLGILTAAIWGASLVVKPSLRRPQVFHFAVFCFVVWNATSLFWSLSVDDTIQYIKTYVQLALFTWILWDLCTSAGAIAAALQSFILGGYVGIGATLYNYGAGIEISEYSGGRYAGAGVNANDLALLLAMVLPFAWYLATTAGTSLAARILRIVNYAYIPAAIFAMMLTGSRSFLFGVVPFAFYLFRAGGRTRMSSRVLFLFLLLIATVVAVPYLPESVLERLATTRHSIASADLGGRVPIWEYTLGLFAQNPLLGVGCGVLHASPPVVGPVVHNTFLSVAAELGLPGLLIFACILAIAFRQAASQPRTMSQLWLTVLAIWLIGSSVLTWEATKPTWFILSLVVISANLPGLCDGTGGESDVADENS